MQADRVVIQGIQTIAMERQKVDTEHIQPKECLIETKVSLISAGTELSRVYGLKQGATYPSYPGYCAVGKVLQVGDDVKDVQPDDRVLFSGTHASVQLFDREHSDGGVLYRLDPQTSDEEGALLMMGWIAMNGILPAEVKPGDCVVVMGLGMLGLLCSIYYQQMGVRVIAVEPVAHRAQLARKAGIKEIVDCSPEVQVAEILAKCGAKGADIVVDASGLSACIETAMVVAAPYGQVLLMGSPRTPYEGNLTNAFSHIHMKMLTVIGCLNRRYPYQAKEGSRLSMVRSMRYIEELLQKKIIDADLLITHRIAPNAEQLMQAYDGLMYHKETYSGVIIDWERKN